jgi:hypothetical protein
MVDSDQSVLLIAVYPHAGCQCPVAPDADGIVIYFQLELHKEMYNSFLHFALLRLPAAFLVYLVVVAYVIALLLRTMLARVGQCLTK